MVFSNYSDWSCRNTDILIMEYKFSYDWFSKNIPVWSALLEPVFKDVEAHAIELGSFEGRSTVWLLENILTHAKSTIDCVDTWQGGVKDDRFEKEIDWKQGELNFIHNTENFKEKITVHKEITFDYMKKRVEPVDLIYVDAGHFASDCLIDMVQSHLLLKKNGILIVDDYLWTKLESNPYTPKPAIDAFINCFSPNYELLALGYQVILKKI